MRYVKLCFFFFLLFFFSLLTLFLKQGSLEQNQNISYVIILEIVVIVITALLCFCYTLDHFLPHRKKEIECKPSLRIYFFELSEERNEFTMLMKDTLIIGRNSAKTHLAYPYHQLLEEQHCRLIFENDTMFLEDLNTKIGTLVNDKKISIKHILYSGDIITMGNIRLQIMWSYENK